MSGWKKFCKIGLGAKSRSLDIEVNAITHLEHLADAALVHVLIELCKHWLKRKR